MGVGGVHLNDSNAVGDEESGQCGCIGPRGFNIDVDDVSETGEPRQQFPVIHECGSELSIRDPVTVPVEDHDVMSVGVCVDAGDDRVGWLRVVLGGRHG
jgi:hypothetical protein